MLLVNSGDPEHIRLIDLGAGCYEDKVTFSYIQSRFYRAPEVLLGMEYGMEIDMWSLGVMLCELFTGEPLLPGHNERHQLACIVEVLGMPPPRMRNGCPRRHKYFGWLIVWGRA